jgi:hypothetical protein
MGSLSLIVGSHFYSIATQLHATPVAGVIFGRVIKVENTGWIPTLLDQGKVRPA